MNVYTNNQKFLEQLKVGDIVEARFTNIGGWHVFPAKIVKVNEKSVRVVRSDGMPVWAFEFLDREFVIPKLQSKVNGIFPAGSSKYATPPGGNL